MTENGVIQILVFLAALAILVKPLGAYMAWVYEGKTRNLKCHRIEQGIYKLCGIACFEEMNWKAYLTSLLIFNLLGFMAVYALEIFQAYLPLNPQHFANVSPILAFNSAVSFVSNTNWQAYSGETTMSYFTQMLAFTTQNFISAATGMAVLVALIRGLTRKETTELGNFWVDTVRGTLYILLPLAFIFAIFLISQGVVQTLKPYITFHTLQSAHQMQQTLAVGPVASQEAIKQLGSNGGGFFNANSAHPFENPTPLSNFFEMLALILIPAALCYTFGTMIKDKRQGWALFFTMMIIFVPLVFLTYALEAHGNPLINQLSALDHTASNSYATGNMEGKEVRFGIVNSSIWATATTAASNGSVNAALDSFTPAGGLIPLWLMQLGEVVFGGVGSGLYGMLIMVIITVFVAGLMVGRTPEYLGKKIEPFEMKMASLAILVMPLTVLLSTAFTAMTQAAVHAVGNPLAHGFSEILYAYTSMANNNGSGFQGLNSNLPIFNLLGGLGMLIGRYLIIIPVLAIAGSMAQKKIQVASSGTLPTHTPFFIALLIVVILIVGALTFLPALALGPIVEQLTLLGVSGGGT